MSLSPASEDVLVWMAMMHGAYLAMPEEKRAELDAWEAAYVGPPFGVATSDWPGWQAILPPKPSRGVPQPARRPLPFAVRLRVYARDGHACRRCGTADDLQIDHIIPVAAGGSDDESNLQVLCGFHNRAKGARVGGGA